MCDVIHTARRRAATGKTPLQVGQNTKNTYTRTAHTHLTFSVGADETSFNKPCESNACEPRCFQSKKESIEGKVSPRMKKSKKARVEVCKLRG